MDLETGLTAIALAFLVAGGPANVTAAAGNQAKGTLTYRTYTVELRYAWLVKGPWERDPGRTIRRLILSAADIGPQLKACGSMSCAAGRVTQGMTVDFDTPPRLDYWVALNGQTVQYSYGARPEAFVAHANDARHLAGKLTIDDVAVGGPRVDAEFDVTVFKEFGSD